jgi:hypothetical protein
MANDALATTGIDRFTIAKQMHAHVDNVNVIVGFRAGEVSEVHFNLFWERINAIIDRKTAELLALRMRIDRTTAKYKQVAVVQRANERIR